MEYNVTDLHNEKFKFSISYKELKNFYSIYSGMDDLEFFSNIKEILHFCCIVSYFKELTIDQTLGDKGIIHEISHLLLWGHDDLEGKERLKYIRECFDVMMKLA